MISSWRIAQIRERYGAVVNELIKTTSSRDVSAFSGMLGGLLRPEKVDWSLREALAYSLAGVGELLDAIDEQNRELEDRKRDVENLSHELKAVSGMYKEIVRQLGGSHAPQMDSQRVCVEHHVSVVWSDGQVENLGVAERILLHETCMQLVRSDGESVFIPMSHVRTYTVKKCEFHQVSLS